MTHHDVPARRPLLRLDLSDGDRAVGWIRGRRIGFRGFANEHDAGVAAWVAHGTVARRLGPQTGAGPVLIDVEPLAFERRDEREIILASDQVIGTLLRPAAGSRSGSDSFGFELEVPAPADELRMRSIAHLIYRTLRRSGVRWSAPVPDVNEAKPSVTRAGKHRVDSPSIPGGIAMHHPNAPIAAIASLPPPAGFPSASGFVGRFLLIGIAVVAAFALIVTAPLTVTVPLGFVFFAYLAGTLVLSASERLRQRRRASRGRGPRGTSRLRDAPTHAQEPDATDRMPSAAGALAAASIGPVTCFHKRIDEMERRASSTG